MIHKEDIDRILNEDDYYKILGVDKQSSASEIEKVFRKLSVKWHPDKVKVKDETLRESALSVYKKINEAKEVLTDANKREVYDKYGKEALKGSGPDMHPEQHADMMNEFMKQMFGQQQRSRSKVPNINLVEEFTLEELFSGKVYKKEIQRFSLCKDCNGFGTEDGLDHKCKDCGGTGMQVKVSRQGNMIQQMQQVCNLCKGSGSDTNVKTCQKCSGKKLIKENEEITIKIPKGAFNGITVEIQNAGNEIPLQERSNDGRTRSSIAIKIKEKKHSIYERGFTLPNIKDSPNPKDLKINMKITLAESLVGFSKTIKSLDGKNIPIVHDKIIKHGEILVLPNCGMPVLENSEITKLGNLFLVFEVEYPQNISGNTKKILWQLLQNTPYKEVNTNGQKFVLESSDKYKTDKNSHGGVHLPPGFKAHFGGNDNESDDDDSGMHGQPGVTECKVQ